MKAWIQKHQLISFFSLTYLIAFGVTFAYILLRPGEPSYKWSLDWFLNAFSPTISALILSWIIGGGAAVRRLLSGFTRWKVGLRWYFAAALLVLGPLAFALVYKALGNPIPGLQPGWTLSLILGQLVFQLFSGPYRKKPTGSSRLCFGAWFGDSQDRFAWTQFNPYFYPLSRKTHNSLVEIPARLYPVYHASHSSIFQKESLRVIFP